MISLKDQPLFEKPSLYVLERLILRWIKVRIGARGKQAPLLVNNTDTRNIECLFETLTDILGIFLRDSLSYLIEGVSHQIENIIGLQSLFLVLVRDDYLQQRQQKITYCNVDGEIEQNLKEPVLIPGDHIGNQVQKRCSTFTESEKRYQTGKQRHIKRLSGTRWNFHPQKCPQRSGNKTHDDSENRLPFDIKKDGKYYTRSETRHNSTVDTKVQRKKKGCPCLLKYHERDDGNAAENGNKK